jgi:mutator family transposase
VISREYSPPGADDLVRGNGGGSRSCGLDCARHCRTVESKVDRLVEQMGIEGMTKDRVSAMYRALDEQVELFRQRPLEGAYPTQHRRPED